MKGLKKTILIVVLLIALLAVGMTLASCAVTVDEGYAGVVMKWGKAQDDVLTPGFYIVAPWTNVRQMDTRWQKYTVKTSAFSKDIQQVDVVMSLNYSLNKDGVLRMYKTVGVDYADKIMLPRALDALKSTFARYSAEELVSNREAISYEVAETLDKELAIYDLTVRELAIEDIDFTDAFTDAIEAKQVATQKKLQVQTEQEQQTLVARGEAERAKIAAQADAEQRLIRAQAEADAVKIAADAEAYRLEQESKNITEMVIQKETVEKWDGRLPTISGTGATPIVNVSDMLNAE